jgi:hypothetical protein
MAIYVVAAIVVLGVIGNFIPEDEPVVTDSDGDGVVDTVDACAVVPGPESNGGCPAAPNPNPPVNPNPPGPGPGPEPRPDPPRDLPVTERWRDDAGNVYVVERDGDEFEGSANNVVVAGINYGHVDIEGVVSPRGGRIVMSNNLGVVYQSPIGASGPGTDPRTTDALFGTMRFHIDH